MPHRDYNEARFARVLDYLHRHFRDPIALEHVADIACLSPHHWHRIYRAVCGETVHETVKRMRLHHAAFLLLNTQQSVEHIARECGYSGNSQSFDRIFRQAYGVSPKDYRRHSRLRSPRQPQTESKSTMHEVRMTTLDALPVAALPHRGDYMKIGQTFDRLESLLSLRGQLPHPQARYFGIYFDDPACSPASALRAQAAVFIGGQAVRAPLEGTTLSGGRYAVLRHRGPYAELHRAYDWFYREWLLQSPHRVRNAPCIEEHLNDWKITAAPDWLTDIYMPLED